MSVIPDPRKYPSAWKAFVYSCDNKRTVDTNQRWVWFLAGWISARRKPGKRPWRTKRHGSQ